MEHLTGAKVSSLSRIRLMRVSVICGARVWVRVSVNPNPKTAFFEKKKEKKN